MISGLVANAVEGGLSQSLKMVVEWTGRGRISERLYEGSPA
jgi:hypothetical protein